MWYLFLALHNLHAFNVKCNDHYTPNYRFQRSLKIIIIMHNNIIGRSFSSLNRVYVHFGSLSFDVLCKYVAHSGYYRCNSLSKNKEAPQRSVRNVDWITLWKFKTRNSNFDSNVFTRRQIERIRRSATANNHTLIKWGIMQQIRTFDKTVFILSLIYHRAINSRLKWQIESFWLLPLHQINFILFFFFVISIIQFYDYPSPPRYRIRIYYFCLFSIFIFIADTLIYRLSMQRVLDVSADWTEDQGDSKYSSIQFDFRVTCDDHYYGQGCENLCRPRDDQFGHYTCSSTGGIVCLSGWQGDYCTKRKCFLV